MKKIRLLVKIIIFIFIFTIIAMIGLYTYAFFSPKLDLKTSGSIYLYDNKGDVIYQGSRNNEWVNLDEISRDLINAIVSVEDKNFYNHHGFDYLRIVKAMYNNIKKKAIVQGASTISQQYIKNLYLDFSQTWNRKLEEAFLTLELEVHYSKEEILEGYLNTINFGHGNMGIVSAAAYYFNKKPSELTLEESIILAGIPKNPLKYNPVSNYDGAINRGRIVAKSMVNNKYLSEDDYNKLFNDKIYIYGESKNNNSQMIMYYHDAVLKELKNIKEIPNSLIESGGLKIFTTLDIDAQMSLESNIKNQKVDEDIQIASVIVNPKTGAVEALTGGMDYKKSQYNRALNSKRQVGSTMKPFLYYAALENNMTTSSTFRSEESSFNLSSGLVYSPQNASNIYANKEITMAAAISLSDNIYAVKTHLFLGMDKMIEVANRCGIKESFSEVASLPLGTKELNLLDFATGYTTLADNGFKKDLYFIERVEDLDGNIIYQHEDKKILVLNPNYTYILNEALTATTSEAFVDYTTPTALNIKSLLTHKYAIKTGSTNNDYWIVGYNKDKLMMVWSGYDDNTKKNNANIRTSTKRIWAKTIEDCLDGISDTWYEVPKNVVAVPLDGISGEISNDQRKTFLFYYVMGSEPNSNFVLKEE